MDIDFVHVQILGTLKIGQKLKRIKKNFKLDQRHSLTDGDNYEKILISIMSNKKPSVSGGCYSNDHWDKNGMNDKSSDNFENGKTATASEDDNYLKITPKMFLNGNFPQDILDFCKWYLFDGLLNF